MKIPFTAYQLALGWVEEITGDIAKQLGVADGSFAVYYHDSGRIRVEMLPPPSPELVEAATRTSQKFKEAFEEMKRLGD